jgi:thymidylate synthase
VISHICDDTHVYKNHIEPLKEQLLRKPRPFPSFKINPMEKKNIDDFIFEDFELIDYDTIKLKIF